MNDLQTSASNTALMAANDYAGINSLLDPNYFGQVMAVAEVMASSSLIPESLRFDKPGDTNKKPLPFDEVKANCFLITNQAFKWKADPFAVAQCCSVVYGRLMYEGKLVAAILAGNLGIKLHYSYGRWDAATKKCIEGEEAKGEDLAVRVWEVLSTDPVTGEPRLGKRYVDGFVGAWKTDGKGSPWSPPNWRRQLSYRGSREWCRIHEPGIMVGIITDDEFDGPTIDLEAAPAGGSKGASASVIDQIAAAKAGQGAASGFDDTRVQETKNTGDAGKTDAASTEGPLDAKGGKASSGTDKGGSQADQQAGPSASGDEAPKPSSDAPTSAKSDDTQTQDLLDGSADSQGSGGGSQGSSEDSQGNAPSGDDKSPNEVKAWLHGVTEMLWAATHFNSHTDTLKAQKKAAQASYPSTGIPERERNKATSVFDRCMDVASGALEPDDAKEVLAGLTGIDIQRLHTLDTKKREAGR